MKRDMSVEEKGVAMMAAKPDAIQVDDMDCFATTTRKSKIIAVGVSIAGQPFKVKEIKIDEIRAVEKLHGFDVYMEGRAAFSTDSPYFLEGWLKAQAWQSEMTGVECPRRIENVEDVDHE